MITISTDKSLVCGGAWDYPLDDLDYLLEERDGETFVLIKDKDGDYRLAETDNSQFSETIEVSFEQKGSDLNVHNGNI